MDFGTAITLLHTCHFEPTLKVSHPAIIACELIQMDMKNSSCSKQPKTLPLTSFSSCDVIAFHFSLKSSRGGTNSMRSFTFFSNGPKPKPARIVTDKQIKNLIVSLMVSYVFLGLKSQPCC